MIASVDKDFWSGKKVFITGHTGFKGGWLTLWLFEMGAIVKGYSLPPPTVPSFFDECCIEDLLESEIGDIRDFNHLHKSVLNFKPDVVIHMAAQSLVRESYDSPVTTYDTNLMGTVNVLESVRLVDDVRVLINITTDKCYENKEWEWGYREEDLLGGYDPYSNSKSCAEFATASYRQSFFSKSKLQKVVTVRAGNVIGGGDWAKDRLVPDILKACGNNESVAIRNPNAVRPWQHVLEPLSGYLILAQSLWNSDKEYFPAWNFGPHQSSVKSVGWIANKISELWPRDVHISIDDAKHPHEASILKLDISRALTRLNWVPKLKIEQALLLTVDWHYAYLNAENMRDFSLGQIKDFIGTNG